MNLKFMTSKPHFFPNEHPSILDFTQGAIEGPVPWKQFLKNDIFSRLFVVSLKGMVCVCVCVRYLTTF